VNDMSPIAELPRTELAIRNRQAAILRRIESGPLPAEEAAENEALLGAMDDFARRSGLIGEPVQAEIWLTRFLNRWRLGEALAKIERGAGPGRGKKAVPSGTAFRGLLQRLRIVPRAGFEAQRLACMPWAEALAYCDRARADPNWRTFTAGLAHARRWWQKFRRIERLEEIGDAAELGALGKSWPIILADPPWRYENPPIGASNRSVENHYPTMSLEEIATLRIDEIAANDAVLYLWATAPKLRECMEVIKAWGFVYRTNLVWIKDKIGMGFHARNQHELLLIAKRGSIPPPAEDDRVSSVVYADRLEHSVKPAIFYELIERFYPTLPKIELFARGAREGWASWGNQAAP
jgi:N6-adenosine-specific RNA methylase IME4